MNDLTIEQRLQKARVFILNSDDWRWMGGVVLLGNVTYDNPEVQTAATDGLNEFYNREWMASLTDHEIRGVVLHENLHKLFRHLHTWQNLFTEDATTAGIATDAVINNQYLSGKKNIALPKGGVNMPQYADSNVWTTKKIYDDLRNKMQGGGGSGQNSHDQHLHEEAKQMTEAEAKALGEQIDAALRQAAMAGALGANMPKEIKDALVPPVDWRSELSEFVKTHCAGFDKGTWRKPHRTYIAHDLYLPSPYSEKLGKIAVFGDTSGSIGPAEMGVFMAFMQQVCDETNPEGLDIAWWDTEVRGVDRFKRGEYASIRAVAKPKGGGGTRPACCTHWLDKEKARDDYVCAIVITDGEFYDGDVGNWGSLPVFWLVVNERGSFNIGVGKTIHVKNL